MIAGAVAGCVLSSSLVPIEDPTKRLQFPGFSILPPRGPQWMMGSASMLPDDEKGVVYRAVFFRTPASSDRAAGGGAPKIWALARVLGDVRFRSPGEFVESMKTLGARTRQRHRVLASRASLVPRADATCAAYDYEVEDAGVVIAVRGVRCLHPQWPSYAIDLSYVQRLPAGAPSVVADAEVAPFLGGLAFTPDRP